MNFIIHALQLDKWRNRYNVLAYIPEATLTILDSAFDCPKLALRNKGQLYAAILDEDDRSVMICCRVHNSIKGMGILVFISISDTATTIYCTTHKKKFHHYTGKSKIYAAHGISDDTLLLLNPHKSVIQDTILNDAIEMDSLIIAMDVVLDIMSAVDISYM